MTATIIITDLKLEEEIKAIRVLEAKENEIKELRKEKEALIKKVMDEAGIEVLEVGGFTVKFTTYIKNQFDVTKFKKLNKAIYDMFVRHVDCKKFSIV